MLSLKKHVLGSYRLILVSLDVIITDVIHGVVVVPHREGLNKLFLFHFFSCVSVFIVNHADMRKNADCCGSPLINWWRALL